ncbi:MAG: PAS domain S-box protein [Desulfatitalea sp.]
MQPAPVVGIACGIQVALMSEENVPDISKRMQAMSLHTFLTRLIWLCVIPLVLLAVYQAATHVRALQSQYHQQAEDLAHNVAAAIDHHLAARIAGLQMLAASPLVDDPPRLSEFYREAQGSRESFGSHIVLADTAMQMLLNTRVPFGESLPKLPTPKGHAAAPEVLATGRPSVGDMFHGPIAKEPLIAIAVPVARAGQTRYLLLSTIEARQFQQRLDQVALPPGWILTLRDGRDEVIAQRAPPESAGRSAEGSAQGHFFTVPSAVAHWSVALGIPLAIYHGPLVTVAAALAVAILIVTLISVLGGRVAARRLGRAVKSLAQTPPAPAGRPRIAEIETVGHMLADAAVAREKAEAMRREAESALRNQELLLREMGRIAKIGGWEFDPTTGRGTWTEEVARIHDLDPADETSLAQGMAFYQGDSHAKIEKAVMEAIERAIPYDLELELVTAKDVHKWVHTIGRPVVENARVVQVRGSFQDITKLKQAELALRDSEYKFRMIVENSRDIIYTLSVQGELLFVSPAISHLLGYDAAELIGRPFQSILHPEDVAACEEAFQRSIREGVRVPGFEYRVRHAGGEWRWHNSTGGAVNDARGNLLHFQGVARDITEQRKLEEQLRQAQKMESVGRLAGGVAHDYNNMLSVILGYTELALARVPSAEPLHADLKEIFNAARRSADITRQLLAFARRQTIAPEVLDLNASVESLLKMLRRLIGEDIDLAWLPGSGLWPVRMDPSQLDQILANLCVNARDAISDIGKIIIETQNSPLDEAYCAEHAGFSPGHYVLLMVSDDGHGMDKKVLDHLFEPFFTTKEVGKGTGLGLATVYGIVKQNNGFINVYSEPGKGSTFRVYLPRYTGQAVDAPKAKAGEIPKGRGETVLVVEDEEAILKLAKKILEGMGYRVLTAIGPGDAIGLAGRHDGAIHLLITDVVMPGMNGRELAERLRAIHPELKCLFMSGYTAELIAHRGVLHQGVHFLQKPFSTHELAHKVREVLDQS